MKKIRFVLALLGTGACMQNVAPPVVPAPIVVHPAAATGTPAASPPAIHWYRNSAEMRGLYLEIYKAAGDQLSRLAAAAAPDTWAVILDADETVLDNSEYEKERGTLPYSDSAWKEWVSREAASALPGSIGFIRHAQQLGGRVVIVTNRDSGLCDMTRENFRKDSIPFDLMLCRTTSSDKNARFQAVENGTASPGVRPLKVLMWVGDNIQDFPSLSQTLRSAPDSAYNAFGTKYFLLPNPMYGSWEKVEYR